MLKLCMTQRPSVYGEFISILPHYIAPKYLIICRGHIPTKVHLRILAKHEIRFR
jgi:hypothetical protein